MYNADRSSFIPKTGAVAIRSKNSPAVAYLIEGRGKPCAMGFFGNAVKPTFHYSFRTVERRAEYVAQWLKDMDATQARRLERKAERKAFAHTLTVGAVLRSSWGYDQTNIEFFEVIALIGKSMVEIREIAQERTDTGHMSGDCVPTPGEYIGAPMRKRVLEGNSIDIHGGFGYARPVEVTIVAGAKVYAASHWTAYA